ncbi:cation-efflux pump [Marinivivus vitaminiproducens]|uniref:cation-efflux pump n=1 Tax=Marinivivus vitaminiproducens TaxID=3035935 RepID=UPI0027A94AE2|nr:cation-efflux pump [Geminicoccaceae bacterium SCSIO 64248]
MTSNRKHSVALMSMLVSASFAATKLVLGLLTGSLALISEATQNTADFAATAVTWWAVRLGDKPADANHPYGHAKVESVAALVEVVLLFTASVWIGYEAIARLITGSAEVDASMIAIGVLAASIAIDFWRSRVLRQVARETGSPALEADALNFFSDMLSSGVVLVGMACVALGYPLADALAALVVAGFILFAAIHLGHRTLASLIDTAPAGVGQRAERILMAMPTVVAVERVRVRPAGAMLFVEASVAVSRALPAEQVARVQDEACRRLREALPNADVTVGAHPRALDSETAETRVRLIAGNRGDAIHHVIVQDLGGRLAISFDLEVDGRMELVKAHDIASALEGAIKDDLGDDVEVDAHIEPIAIDEMAGEDAPVERTGAIDRVLRSLAEGGGPVHDVHNVRVRRTEQGEVVNFHCRVDPALSVRDMHDAVDDIESRLRRAFPEVLRVIGHAEPARPTPVRIAG